jgi:hypothetical protein
VTDEAWVWTTSDLHTTIAEMNYAHDKDDRHRLSKEIAEELLKDHGVRAYMFCVEKLTGGTQQPQLWRDVLSYLDELTAEKRDEDL